jgi:hypothetical protein
VSTYASFLEVIGAPSMLRLTRKAAALARVLPTFALSCEENAREESTAKE